MMNYTWVQFPDLTEIGCISPISVTLNSLKEIQTEFFFYVGGPLHNTYYCKDLGLTPISCMNNWWPSHCGEERKMTLYFMRAPSGKQEPVQATSRVTWGRGMYNHSSEKAYHKLIPHMAGSGCGVMLGEPPLMKKLYHRFFTLLRMPVEPSRLQKKWMEGHNYRHIDTGKLASYWVNGWKPKEYDIKKEYAYFKTSKQEWRAHGEDGYAICL